MREPNRLLAAAVCLMFLTGLAGAFLLALVIWSCAPACRPKGPVYMPPEAREVCEP